MSMDNSGSQVLPAPGKEKAKHKRGRCKSAHKGLNKRGKCKSAHKGLGVKC